MNLQNVYWLGGSPCAGKTTAADKLQFEHPVTVYHTDDLFLYASISPERQPRMAELRGLDNPLRIWNRPVEDCVAFWLQYYEEVFELLLEHLTADKEVEGPLVMEGICLLPELLQRHGLLERAMFLTCSPALLEEAIAEKFKFLQELEAVENREAIYQNILATFTTTAAIVYDGARKYGCPTRTLREKEDYRGNYPALHEWILGR